MSIPVPGQIRAVSGGYGLMLVVTVDTSSQVAQLRGHGPKDSEGHWFDFNRLSEPVNVLIIKKEFNESRARNVSCNNRDCWCSYYLKNERLSL